MSNESQLKARLSADPTNLQAAWDYWNALPTTRGHDPRSSSYVIKIFQVAALHSLDGVLAISRAFRQLYESSKEYPKGISAELYCAIVKSYENAPDAKRADIKWLIDAMNKPAEKESG